MDKDCLGYLADETDEEVTQILELASSAPPTTASSPIAESSGVNSANESWPAGNPDLFGAETLLLLAGASSDLHPAPACVDDCEVSDPTEAEHRDDEFRREADCWDNTDCSNLGLSVLCQGIEFLDSLPVLPGIDLLCSITRYRYCFLLSDV
jgi:hypothetical protein